MTQVRCGRTIAAVQPSYDIYRRLPSLVLGFHGCDRVTGERVLQGKEHLKPSQNAYDWLGNGVYFWENDPQRAYEFAQQAMQQPVSRGRIREPFVVGAVIDLGLCLNLLERRCLDEVALANTELERLMQAAGKPVPQNRGPERALRFRDRAVIEMLHYLRAQANRKRDSKGKHPPYDTVRAAFMEGGPIYPDAGFNAKNHIQIAVCNTDCIKGYFVPRAS
jgi:hypothetical protein